LAGTYSAPRILCLLVEVIAEDLMDKNGLERIAGRNLEEQRPVSINRQLMSEVNFAVGLLGHLDKAGKFSVKRMEVVLERGSSRISSSARQLSTCQSTLGVLFSFGY
jgi:hypothetical protein